MDKILKLLKFYKKNNSPIQFRLKNNMVTNFKGIIIDLDYFFPSNDKSLVITDDNQNKTKIFIDDINIDSLVPIHLINQMNIINQRTTIPPKLRFEIFKRDNFKCYYCGKTKDESELEVDHVIPVSKGGNNDPSNLVTSCFKCNRGKGGENI